jgi:Bacterial EndoU nuclease
MYPNQAAISGGAVPIDHAGQADDPDITSQPDHPSQTDHPSPPDGPRPPDAIPHPSDPADRDAIHRAYRAQVDRIYAAHERTDTPADDGAGARRPSSGADQMPITDHPGWPDTDSVKIDSDRAKHILEGDGTGGGHRAGTGKPGKTEFPAKWDDDKVLSNIEDVARNPDYKPYEPQSTGRWLYEGTRDDVHMYVVVNPDGTIRAAWPREGDPGVIKNPKES